MTPVALKPVALKSGAWDLGTGRGGFWERSGGCWVGADFLIHTLLGCWLRGGRRASAQRPRSRWVGTNVVSATLTTLAAGALARERSKHKKSQTKTKKQTVKGGRRGWEGSESRRGSLEAEPTAYFHGLGASVSYVYRYESSAGALSARGVCICICAQVSREPPEGSDSEEGALEVALTAASEVVSDSDSV